MIGFFCFERTFRNGSPFFVKFIKLNGRKNEMTKAKREAGIIAPVNNTLSLEARGCLTIFPPKSLSNRNVKIHTMNLSYHEVG